MHTLNCFFKKGEEIIWGTIEYAESGEITNIFPKISLATPNRKAIFFNPPSPAPSKADYDLLVSDSELIKLWPHRLKEYSNTKRTDNLLIKELVDRNYILMPGNKRAFWKRGSRRVGIM